MPIPFTEEAIYYVAKRIAQTQEILERRIAIENVSYYLAPSHELTELEFMQGVLSNVDCDVLLDVNNVYVNSINHQTDAKKFIKAIPSDRIAYLHVAGHYREADDLIIDTHAEPIIDPVWELLEFTYRTHGLKPTLLERDDNIPALDVLMEEVEHIVRLQKACMDA